MAKATARKLEEKIAATQRKIEDLDRRLAVAQHQRSKARLFLANTIPTKVCCSMQKPILTPPLAPEGFDPVSVDLAALREALDQSSYSIIFKSIAKVVDCLPADLCLIENRQITRAGKKIMVAGVRYVFNRAVNEFLKGTQEANFEMRSKSWLVQRTGDVMEHLNDGLKEYFAVVVDIDEGIVYRNGAAPAQPNRPAPIFRALPYQVRVEVANVLVGIIKARGCDEVRQGTLALSNAKEFVVLTSDTRAIITRAPFLLFRYAVVDGRPRYVSYSTLGQTVEQVVFGGDQKKAAAAIARYRSTFDQLQLSADTVAEMPVDQVPGVGAVMDEPTAAEKASLQGDFERFDGSFQRVKAVFPGIEIAPLCSDYVSLLSQGAGGDSADIGCMAYVAVSEGFQGYLARIAGYFGYAPAAIPIVFTRKVTDAWQDVHDDGFFDTLIHELAHATLWRDLPAMEDGHGLAWAVHYEILSMLLTGKSRTSIDFKVYNPAFMDLTAEEIGIDRAVREVALPMLADICATRELRTEDVAEAAMTCACEIGRGAVADSTAKVLG